MPLIKAWINQIRIDIGKPADGNPPTGVDYDRWLGPAPKRPFNENRFHYTWRFFWDYGNSEIGNQGVHVLDVAMWAIQVDARIRRRQVPAQTHLGDRRHLLAATTPRRFRTRRCVTYDYGDMMLNFELRSFATDIWRRTPNRASGRRAPEVRPISRLLTTAPKAPCWRSTTAGRSTGATARSSTTKASGGSHESNFLEAVKTRNKPNADVEIGRLSTMLCHLGNVVLQTRPRRAIRSEVGEVRRRRGQQAPP